MMAEAFPPLPKSEIELVADTNNKAIQRIKTFSQKYVPVLTKSCAKFDKLYNELIVEPAKQSMEEDGDQKQIEENVVPELSVCI